MNDRWIIALTWVCILGFCLVFWGLLLSAAFGQTAKGQNMMATDNVPNLPKLGLLETVQK